MTALPKARRPSAAFLFASVALIAALAGCESAPPPPPPPPVAAAPPPPPPVLLPSRVIESASAYRAYVDRAAAIDAGFNSGESVAAALKVGETYQSDQLQKGETAYAAILALQDPTFVATLRGFARDAAQRTQIANAIMADPTYATTFKGADSAAGLVVAGLSEQANRLTAAGAKVKQAAYDVQHQSWSKADVPDRPGRLELAKSLSAGQSEAVAEDALRLRAAATGDQPMTLSAAPPVGPPYTPLVARALAVAAMAALGEGGEEYTDQLSALLADTVESGCLHMAKLNLYQCLAVSKPNYEDVFCLGQHILADTGQCIMKGAQYVAYVAPAPALAPSPDVSKPVTKTSRHKKKKTVSTATEAR